MQTGADLFIKEYKRQLGHGRTRAERQQNAASAKEAWENLPINEKSHFNKLAKDDEDKQVKPAPNTTVLMGCVVTGARKLRLHRVFPRRGVLRIRVHESSSCGQGTHVNLDLRFRLLLWTPPNVRAIM